MKNKLFLLLSLISIMAMLVGTAANPLESRSISLAEVRFVQGKGVVFLFDITGKFTKSDLDTAYAYAGGNSLDVHCVIKKGQDQIACTVHAINQYAGQSVLIGLLGQGFWATVPYKCLGFSVVFPFEPTSTYIYAWSWFGSLGNWGFSSQAEFFAFYESSPFFYIFPNKCVTDASLLQFK